MHSLCFLLGILLMSHSSWAAPLSQHQSQLKTLRPYDVRLQERANLWGVGADPTLGLNNEKTGYSELLSGIIDIALADRGNATRFDAIISHEIIGLEWAESVHRYGTSPIYQSGIVDGFIHAFETATGDKKILLAMMLATVYNIPSVFEYLQNLGWTELDFDQLYAPKTPEYTPVLACIASVNSSIPKNTSPSRVGSIFRSRY